MVRWVAVPQCVECEVAMTEDSDGDWECPQCGNVIYDEDLDEE